MPLLAPPQTDVLQKKTSQIRQIHLYGTLYASLLKKWEYHYRDRIDKIFLEAGQVSLPIDFAPFEQYFSGFEFQYFPFDNSTLNKVHGFHEIEGKTIKIYFAENCVISRQRFTIAHELMHVYQLLDHEFLVDLEAIRVPFIRKKLIERIADKAAAYYLAPLPLLQEEARHTCNAIKLAGLFGISPQAAEICLSDYGLCS